MTKALKLKRIYLNQTESLCIAVYTVKNPREHQINNQLDMLR